MLLLPKRIKFSKSYFRNTLSMQAFLFKPILKYGQQCLVANSNSFLVPHQINAALRPIRKHLKKQAKIWTFFSPTVPITKKPNEVRMGKGKGSVKYWSYLIKKNQILFEFTNVKQQTIRNVVISSKTKLPFKSTFLSKY